MIDINLLLEDRGGDPKLIKESQRRRGASEEIVDEIIAQYKEWVKTQFKSDEKNREINAIQKEIGKKYKSKEDPSELIQQKTEIQAQKEALIAQAKDEEAVWKEKLATLGNIVHTSVPTSMDEEENEIVRVHHHEGVEPVRKDGILSHHEVLARLDGYDPERGAKIAGHRAYFLTGVGVELNLAMIQYGLSFLARRDYKKIMPPFFMNKDIMGKTAQLSEFDEALYKVSGDGDDKYLIATSEQPISALHSGEWFEKPDEQLPIRYAGYSTCFRKEAGAHGKDTRGIFRVHQFEKVEQFVLTHPEKSWEMFNEMIQHSEEFFQSLGLTYRVVSIVSGALNNAAAKKYDLEAWFPYLGEYKELVSCSNCTDYQSRRLEIRCGVKKMSDREKKYVHCLNSTLCATERSICAILENWQREDGLEVPPPLVPYMDGRTFIPYAKPAPATKN